MATPINGHAPQRESIQHFQDGQHVVRDAHEEFLEYLRIMQIAELRHVLQGDRFIDQRRSSQSYSYPSNKITLLEKKV
jgi:hypothetical protein